MSQHTILKRNFRHRLLTSAVFSLCIAFSLLLISTPAFSSDQGMMITGAKVLLAEGTLEGDWTVIIDQEGKIEALLPDSTVDEKARKRIYRAPEGSVLTPGLHDLMGALGTRGKPGTLRSGTVLVDENLDAGSSFDGSDPWLDVAAQHGVLYTTLVAQPLGVVNGRSATFLCHTAASATRLGEGKTMLALGDSVLSRDRMPTSRTSLLSIWREWMGTQPDLLKKPGLLFVAEGIDLRQALALPWPADAIPVFIHTGGDARSPIELLGDRLQKSHMVVGPLLEGGDQAHLMMAVRASRQGVELSFAGGLPAGPADHLRGSAAMAVAAGMDAAAARRALFSNPAHVSGATGTGVITTGNRADLVLFSGDPLDPASKVIHVWRGGHGTRVAEPTEIKELETIRK
ncbi:hypothetical protein CBD41_03860 [bacterium TMED181]|nr:hypothetical protein [Planctomycetota bacterium]OUW45512.1 MAG: hypothetical protein CBD41_03860 [bacterium TMED181]